MRRRGSHSPFHRHHSSYYIMSRSLGPELGGAMGCLFYTAFSVSAAFYAIGFATGVPARAILVWWHSLVFVVSVCGACAEVQSTWFPDNHSRWLITLVSSCALGVLVIVALIGAGIAFVLGGFQYRQKARFFRGLYQNQCATLRRAVCSHLHW